MVIRAAKPNLMGASLTAVVASPASKSPVEV
jgi:hypothetical protein